ncbi:MAG: hypothetical protein JNN07_02990 [Verrucomicrobiales bacterium]|nr:hypothetical protein [Verrucomicrobiales bacterium]
MSDTYERLFVGVSGGHTRSSALAFDLERGALGAVEGKRVNFHTDDDNEASANFYRLIADLEKETGIEHLISRAQRTTVVCAGAARIDDQDRVWRNLASSYLGEDDPTNRAKFLVADDTWAGLLAGVFSYKGMCAFAGTGASVFVGDGGIPNCGNRKIDGWGPIIGDFGSGFQLVVDLFRSLGREEARTGQIPELFFPLADYVRRNTDTPQETYHESVFHAPIDGFEQLQEWFDILVESEPRGWRISFAQLAQVVTDVCDRDVANTLARDLIVKSAEQMTESIQLACRRFPEARTLPLVLQGGMFEHSKRYREVVTTSSREFHEGPVLFAKYRPVVGAAIMAAFGFANLPSHGEAVRLMGLLDGLPPEQRQVAIRMDPKASPPLLSL